MNQFPSNGNGNLTYDAIINGGAATLNVGVAIQNLTLTSGTINGNGLLTLFGTGSTWAGGNLGVGVTIGNGGVLTVSGASPKQLMNSRPLTLANGSTLVWSGAAIQNPWSSRSAITIQSGALFDIQGDGQVLTTGGDNSSGTLTLAGTLRKSAGTGTTFLKGAGSSPWVTAHTGTVDVQIGTLDISGLGGSSNGTFTIGSGAKLVMGSGLALNSGTTVSGAGVLSTSGLTIGGDVSVQNLEMAGGAITGNGVLTVRNGTFNWTGGEMTGAGSTKIGSGGVLNVSGTNWKVLKNRPLIVQNGGTLNWTGGAFHNPWSYHSTLGTEAGGVFDIKADGEVANIGGDNSNATFNNAGTLRKSGGTGVSRIIGGGSSNWTFNNTGTVEVTRGTLSIAGYCPQLAVVNGAWTVTGGTWIADASASGSATLEAVGGPIVTVNQGDVRLIGANSVINTINNTLAVNPGRFMVAGGRNFTTLGNFDNSGTLTVGTNSTFTVSGSVPQLSGNTLTAGTWNVEGGTLAINTGGNIAINQANVTLSGANSIFEKINALVDNRGSFTVSGGRTFTASGLFTNTGTLTAGPNGTINLPSGSINRGTIAGEGTVNVSGTLVWDSGSMSGSGATNVTSLDLSAGNVRYLARTLNSSGTVTYASGGLNINTGGVYNNNGIFNVPGLYNVTTTTSDNPGVFNNRGTFNKSSASSINITVPLNNSGTFNVDGGTVSLMRGGTNSGRYDVDAGATLRFTESHTHQAGSDIRGTGVVEFAGGTHSIPGAMSHRGQLVLKAGTVNFEGMQTLESHVQLQGGTMGGSGTLTLGDSAVFYWNSGTMAGPGKTISNVQVNMGANWDRVLARTLETQELGEWNMSTNYAMGTLAINDGGRFVSRGWFEATSAGGFSNTSGTGSFENLGTFRKAGGSTFSVASGVRFDNSGRVAVVDGSLNIGGGGTSRGLMNVVSGSSLSFYSDYTHADGSTIQGNGTVRFFGGTHTFNSPVLKATGPIFISDGTVNFNATQNIDGEVTLFTDVGGSGTITLSKPLDWGYGTIGSPLTVVMAQGSSVELTGPNWRRLAGKMDSSGTINHLDGYLQILDGGWLDNWGTFEAKSPRGISGSTGVGRLRNLGTFNKTTTGVFTVESGVQFDNQNTVNVSAGTLHLADAAYQQVDTLLAGGIWNISGYGVLDLAAGSNIVESAAHVTLDGPNGRFDKFNTMTRNRGRLTLLNGRTFNPSGALHNLEAGTITIGTGSRLTLPNGSSNAGTINGDGELAITGGQFDLLGGVVEGNANLRVPGGSTLNVAAPGGAIVRRKLDVGGSVTVRSGTLRAEGGAYQLSNATLTGGTWNVYDNATLSFGDAVGIFTNNATVLLSGQNARFNGLVLLRNNGSLTVAAGQQYSSYIDMTNAGTVSIDSTSGLTIGTTYNLDNIGQFTSNGALQVRNVHNTGTFRHSGNLGIYGDFTNDGLADIGGWHFWLNGGRLINRGTLHVKSDSGNRTLALQAVAGTAFLESTQHVKSLAVSSGAQVQLNSGGGKVLVTPVLSIQGDHAPTGRLDLADNDLILQSTSAMRQDDLDRTTAQVAAGRGVLGDWTGNGITSSAAGQDPVMTLAVILNDRGNGRPIHTTFRGETVGINDILVAYALAGDTDLDGSIDASDYFRLSRGIEKGLNGYVNGDLDYDGMVSPADYGLIDRAFLAQGGKGLAAGRLAATAVPEPGSLLGLAGAMLVLASRRRRSRRNPD